MRAGPGEGIPSSAVHAGTCGIWHACHTRTGHCYGVAGSWLRPSALQLLDLYFSGHSSGRTLHPYDRASIGCTFCRCCGRATVWPGTSRPDAYRTCQDMFTASAQLAEVGVYVSEAAACPCSPFRALAATCSCRAMRALSCCSAGFMKEQPGLVMHGQSTVYTVQRYDPCMHDARLIREAWAYWLDRTHAAGSGPSQSQ